MADHFIPLRYPARGPAGLLLALNAHSISHVSSRWSREHEQNVLLIHLNNGRHVMVFEEGVADVLEAMGLNEFVEDWTLNLEKDLA
jgi:hypothetical protein